MPGPFTPADFEKLVPADKKKPAPEWVNALTARGAPETWRGAELAFVGIPVGGLPGNPLSSSHSGDPELRGGNL